VAADHLTKGAEWSLARVLLCAEGMSESNDAAASPEAPAAKGGSKLVTILALLNFLAVVGLGGYLFYTQQYAAAQGKKDEAGAKKADPHAKKPADGHGEPKADGHGEAKEGGHGEEAKEGGPTEGLPHGDEHAGEGPLIALESMVTNLADPDSDRYLKVVLQFRLTSEAAKPEVEGRLVPVRNQILIFLSSLTMADTIGSENKRSIQKRIKRIANEAMPSSRITEVYFTEFVIQ
jgi:flagellar protein FliL